MMGKVGHFGCGRLRGSIGPIKFCLNNYGWVLIFLSLSEIIHGQGFRHSEGLNRWSFLSPNEGHDLYSDLLCPNPLLGGSEIRIISSSAKYSSNSSAIIRSGENSPIPNDIWALKTLADITFLPCDLKQYASVKQLPYPTSKQQYGRGSNQTVSGRGSGFVENRILFMNISFQPLDFGSAKLCNTFIKLQYDDEDGVELTCDENPLGTQPGVNHIYWPRNIQKRKKSFAIFRNLERFLQNEETLRQKFYFHIYFTSDNGRNKKCTVQQYELNLSNPGCVARRPRIEDVCGEYNCDDLIFPYYEEKRVKFIWKSDGNQQNGKPSIQYPQYDSEHTNRNNITSNYFITKRFDVRFIVFITTLPIILFGMLIFGLEIIIYVTCLRRSRTTGDANRDARSQQILQNSLNLWESIPNREIRCVSFSPVTTNIDPDGSESPLPDPLLTPRVLKSALKKSTEHLPPPPDSFFEMERECPPTYVEAIMNH